MAVKYICPVCGRRFVDWGAEKLGFKCPGDDCKDETLIVVGSSGEEKEDKPSLKRSRKRKTITPPAAPEADIAEMDGTFIESNDNDDDDDDDAEDEEDAVVVEKDDEIDEDALLDDDDAVDDEEDDTFTDALDIDGDDDPIDED